MTHKILSLTYLLLLLLAGGKTMAQDDQPTGLRFGVRVGGSISSFGKTQPYTSEKAGLTAGLVVEYSLSEKFSVQTEPAYLQQGGQYVRFSDNTRFGDANNIFAVYTTASKVTAHYVDLPLMAKYKLPVIGNFSPNIVLGGSAGYLIDATDKFERTYSYEQTFFTVHRSESISSEFEKFQFGAVAGLGGEVSLGSKRLLIDFRYRYGVTAAKKSFSYIDLYAVRGDLRTNSFYFTVGLGF
jgi:hypothetical protein